MLILYEYVQKLGKYDQDIPPSDIANQPEALGLVARKPVFRMSLRASFKAVSSATETS